MNCHPLSTPRTCYDAWHGAGEDIFMKFDTALFEVNPQRGFPLIAENDRCVAETISVDFWRGRDPGSAFGTTVSAIFAVVSLFTMFF